MATISVLQTLAVQGSSFRGHDESESSLNRGNLIEWLEHLAEWREDVKSVVLKNAPGNAKYTSPLIQKELLAIMANRVRCAIREEVGDASFSMLVDEAQDAAGREQMAIILRFVNSSGVLTERFFGIKSVVNTTSATLKEVICGMLSEHNLPIQKLRGQGYDGSSNMSGQYNGLKALFLQDCPYAYFVHCFAHRLQLTLVAAAKNCGPIWRFYSLLDKIINLVKSSPKRSTELLACRRPATISPIFCSVETGKGANQSTSLQRACATRWSSHFFSVDSMIKMFAATCEVLQEVSEHNSSRQLRAEAEGALEEITTFKFAFCLHMMRKIMMETMCLSQAFQRKSIDILEALGMVSTSKTLLQKLRDDGWEMLLEVVNSFCLKHGIDKPDLSQPGRRGMKKMPLEHLYHYQYFNQCIDYQLSELNSRFSETTVRLLQLSDALDPKDSFKSFNEDHIYQLAVEFYPQDFNDQERLIMRSELPYYAERVVRSPDFEVPSLAKLMEILVTKILEKQYMMICRLICLILTQPVSTATTERAFSAMKFVKTDIRSNMADGFLAYTLKMFIERDYARKLDRDSIIDEFSKLKNRRVQLKL
ncbi:Zinc finger MYM-type protein 1 [Linum perenne]